VERNGDGCIREGSMGDLRLKYEDVVTPIKLGNNVRPRYVADLYRGLETW
jgi:hypothetical protein